MSKLLITGSSGYVGSRLIRALANTHYSLVCVSRNRKYLENRLPKNAKAVEADFSNDSNFPSVFSGCETAFFLIHSLSEKHEFEDIEAKTAKRFLKACEENGIKKIIYLGGLVNDKQVNLSPHMRSRVNVGKILRSGSIPCYEFRASVILGPGSTSFELIRALVERLPVMITPKWVRVKAQPIFIDTVINYLVSALNYDSKTSEVFEIGGKDTVTYKTIMDTYAKSRQLKRLMIPVPFLTPRLSSLWLGLVTPVYARVGRKLIDSITEESVVKNKRAETIFKVTPLPLEDAIKHCLKQEDADFLLARWSDPVSSSIQFNTDKKQVFGNRIIDTYSIEISKNSTEPFKAVETIGGKTGWYGYEFLWQLRGWIDLLCGGIGLRRGRPNRTLQTGDALDWWRVESFELGKRLRLKAEMKLPGRAWLDFELLDKHTHYELKQTVIFDPMGLWGLVYWYSLLPFHYIIFNGMLKKIKLFS